MTTTTQTINVPAGLHYTKSGRLDMRYNSSKEFLARTMPRRPDQHEGGLLRGDPCIMFKV